MCCMLVVWWQVSSGGCSGSPGAAVLASATHSYFPYIVTPRRS